jgi:hypothetical protein
MKHVLMSYLLASLVGCSSGGGTETDNPASVLADFTSSGCKSRESNELPNALTLRSDVAGLECVEWEVQASGELRVLLHNLSEACAEGYQGQATLTDHGLDLHVYQTTCDVFRCGSCAYDFDYRLAAISTAEPLPLRLGWARCASEPPTWHDTLTLPLDEQRSGIVCKSAAMFSLFTYAGSHGSCGERNMPCGDCAEDRTACDDGLMCREFSADDSRCLQSCTASSDCIAGLPCEDGVCRAPAAF